MIDFMLCKKTKSIAQSKNKRCFALQVCLAVCLLALPLLGMSATGNSAPTLAKPTKTPKKGSSPSSGSAYDVIAAVNQVRASNGLAPFEVNAALMASAQAHSNYMASSGSISHTGSGGSSPGSRAATAGFSGSVVENIYGGMNASPQQAVGWWQGDSLHLGTLLSTRHTYAGAGVATSGGVLYYTLDVGSLTGGSSSPSNATGASTASASGAASAPATAVAFNPVLIATPNPDGSVVHVVQAGQTLWTIAATYKIQLADLLQLNGFTSSTFIYPRNKVLIKPASAAAAASASEAISATQSISSTLVTPAGSTASPADATATRPPPTSAVALPESVQPTRSAGSQPSDSAAQLGQPTAQPVVQTRSASSGPDPLLLLVAGLVFGGTGLLVVGNILKRGGD
jgi:uncharacterized protein YkwD